MYYFKKIYLKKKRNLWNQPYQQFIRFLPKLYQLFKKMSRLLIGYMYCIRHETDKLSIVWNCLLRTDNNHTKDRTSWVLLEWTIIDLFCYNMDELVEVFQILYKNIKIWKFPKIKENWKKLSSSKLKNSATKFGILSILQFILIIDSIN